MGKALGILSVTNRRIAIISCSTLQGRMAGLPGGATRSRSNSSTVPKSTSTSRSPWLHRRACSRSRSGFGSTTAPAPSTRFSRSLARDFDQPQDLVLIGCVRLWQGFQRRQVAIGVLRKQLSIHAQMAGLFVDLENEMAGYSMLVEQLVDATHQLVDDRHPATRQAGAVWPAVRNRCRRWGRTRRWPSAVAWRFR